jgi:hypothetical protein
MYRFVVLAGPGANTSLAWKMCMFMISPICINTSVLEMHNYNHDILAQASSLSALKLNFLNPPTQTHANRNYVVAMVI